MCEMWQGTNSEALTSHASFMAGNVDQQTDSCVDKSAEKIRVLEEELAALRHEQSKLYRGIFEAAQIQRRLCAPRQFRTGAFEVAGEIFPVRHLSGDFFKVIELESALGVVIGDIAGKGLSAGIWMPHLVSLLHRCARAHVNPSDAMAQANRELCTAFGEPPLVAAFFARIDLADGSIIYCNAGLPSPLVLGRDNTVARLESGGPMLGAMPNAIFNSGSATLHPGCMLIACSDGVTECQNSRDEEFDLARLSAAAEAAEGRTASHTLFSALGAVLDFADGCPLSDDLTLLVVRREPVSVQHGSDAQDSAALMQGRIAVASARAAGRHKLVS